MRLGRIGGLGAIALAALLGAACRSASDAGTPAAEAPTPSPAATAAAAIATPAIPAPSPTPEPTEALLSGDLPDVPYNMTGYEIIAAGVGPATYSGYRCVISPDGCACEIPLVQDVSFSFEPDGTLVYTFAVGEQQETRSLQRVAPNQWEDVRDIVSEESSAMIGEGHVLVTFTETGYAYNQFVHFYDSGLVSCPEVTFRRMMGAGEDR